jgi:hypothetical protein
MIVMREGESSRELSYPVSSSLPTWNLPLASAGTGVSVPGQPPIIKANT